MLINITVLIYFDMCGNSAPSNNLDTSLEIAIALQLLTQTNHVLRFTKV